jgi:hypothetical protein
MNCFLQASPQVNLLLISSLMQFSYLPSFPDIDQSSSSVIDWQPLRAIRVSQVGQMFVTNFHIYRRFEILISLRVQ